MANTRWTSLEVTRETIGIVFELLSEMELRATGFSGGENGWLIKIGYLRRNRIHRTGFRLAGNFELDSLI
jgi:hypothetical protein